MRKIVFFSIPAHGHTNPTLGVVRELCARGHQVYYYSYEPFRQVIEEAGAVFIPCDSYNAELKLNQKEVARLGKDLAFSTRILVDTTLALDEMVCRDMQQLQPDCIVADSMAVWGKAVALKLSIPFVSSTTTFAFNRHSARIMKQSLPELLSTLLSMTKANRQVKRLRAKGYPVRNILDIIQNDNDTHTIVYTSPQFQPCHETFSDKYAFVGPSVRPASGLFSVAKTPLVYISMGTVNNDLLPFYHSCIRAFADMEAQVVLSVGSLAAVDALGTLPDHICAYAHVDQIAVLQRSDVFLSHCGMNSASESLYFGVPLVMFPQTKEQSGVALRVHQLGAGLFLQQETPDDLRKAVETVLADPSYKANAAAISDGFRRCPGAAGAAEKILQVCAEKCP